MTEEKNEQQDAPKKEAPKNAKGVVLQFEEFLNKYMVEKAPFTLPMGAKEFIVKVAPYLIIIFAALALPIILAALGVSAIVAPFAMMGGFGFHWGLSMAISFFASIIAFVLEIIAVPGLFKRTKKSWQLVFYASIVSVVGSILSIGGLVSGVIGAIIGWYILFQVKELYKN